MRSNQINKYNKKSLSQLLKLAEKKFNKFIRDRDAGKPCISCGKFTELEAGHFYSAGHYPELRFVEDNAHGQCNQCNRHLHGNLNEYRKMITTRISQEDLNSLDMTVDYWRRVGYKWDRMALIEIILKY